MIQVRRRTRMTMGPRNTTPMVRTLLIINGLVFLLQWVLPRYGLVIGRDTLGMPVVHWFGNFFALIPVNLVRRGYIWQLVTYQFLHGGFFHLLINMFVLWMFGVELEQVWGTAGFLRFYLICGIVAGLGMVIFSYGPIPVVGASGAIFGLLGAFAIYWPERMIFIWGIFPMKIKHFVLIIGVITLMSGVSETDSGIAHLAHLFGLLMGLLYCWKGDPRKPLLGSLSSFFRRRKKQQEWIEQEEREQRNQQILKEADEILDRLNRLGWENLSPEERQRIKQISEELNEGN